MNSYLVGFTCGVAVATLTLYVVLILLAVQS